MENSSLFRYIKEARNNFQKTIKAQRGKERLDKEEERMQLP